MPETGGEEEEEAQIEVGRRAKFGSGWIPPSLSLSSTPLFCGRIPAQLCSAQLCSTLLYSIRIAHVLFNIQRLPRLVSRYTYLRDPDSHSRFRLQKVLLSSSWLRLDRPRPTPARPSIHLCLHHHQQGPG